MDEQVISIREILDILKVYWKMIFIITLCVTVLSGFISFFVMKPQYEAGTKIFIGKKEGDEQEYSENDVEMYQQLMKTYIEIIKTKDLIEKSLDKVDINLTANQLLEELTVINIPGTQIIEIKFRHGDPVEARDIIQAITEEFINISTILVSNGSVRVIEDVIIPENPVSPNTKMNVVLASFLGIMISVALSFLLELMNNTYKYENQLEQDLEIPVIGNIPIVDGEKINAYVVETLPQSIAAESYRTLRTNIKYSSFDSKLKVIVITSSEQGDGKTTISGNLALCLAEEEKKVILMDCDLRRPSIHKVFGLSNKVGLSELIVKDMDISSVLHQYNNNLTIMTSGKIPPNPAEMLGSNSMVELLEKLKEDFDYVILDTPPVQAVTDAQILSTKADGTILVVRAEKTKKDSVHNILNLIEKVNGNIVGTVFNGLKVKKTNYY